MTSWGALDEVLRSLPLGGAIFDREMTYLAHNKPWLSAHGWDETLQLAGRSHYDVFAEISDAWRAVHQRCLAGATERSEHDQFVDASGRTHHLRWVVAPWRERDETIGGLVIYVENITDTVTTARRLEERECLIRDMFERSSVGLNLCTMSGLWLESNPAFLEIIGYSREEADGGLTYWDLTPRSYDHQEAVQLESLRARKRYGPYEKEFVRKDGRLIPVRLNGFIVERDGEEYIWSLIEDLTAQRALEQQVEVERVMALQASKLATLGEMAAGIAHEVNNPLVVIAGHSYLARAALAARDDATLKESLDLIDDAVDRAAYIVKGLGRFTRQSAGEPHALLDLAPLVGAAIDLTRARAQSLGVTFANDVEALAPIRGHAVEVSQVLVNLFNNAMDAAAHGDERWVRISADEDNGLISIVVEDSGPAIDATVVPKLFQAFFTTKGVGEGTGIGLSISRAIVEAHGGTLTYEPGARHTRFVMRVRRAQPELRTTGCSGQ